jgi:exopolyphosphatase / guanosine-5'-triphosphate,3'-diphosphate pyrophosphatase
MATLAAIDIGSNALRLAIAKVDASGQYAVVHSGREPVRLGQDVFSTGALSAATIEKAVEAFGRFREQIDKHTVTSVKAAATSALREASNSDELIKQVIAKTGIEISVIGPEEEARLVHLALRDIVNLKNKVALLIDIGGGSVEVSLATHTGILSTESYQMGSVRLLQILQHQRLGEKRFYQLVSKYVDTIEQRLKRELGNQKLDYCIGTGGSVESIAALRRELFGKNNVSKIRSQELDSAVKTLQAMSVEERVQRLQLRPDRADVIVPAAIVLQKIVHQAAVEEVIVPGASLKDGLILEMVSEQMHPERHLDYDQVISSAMQLGRKFAFDEQHAVAVANLAVQLFDQTRAIHEMGPDSRTLLEVAALLHDIGQFVNTSNHHKHGFYLLQASSVIGLTPQQMTVVANIARYHRKSLPKPQHKNFEELAPKQRAAVLTLAAILRLANALDREHAGNVTGVELAFKKPKFTMKLKGQGEMLLAKWAVATRCDLFEQVFDGKLVVEGAENA